jgi:hypothetical protein
MESPKINRIKIALVENGKTGKWLAEQVGKNEATVSRWCSNKMQLYSSTTFAKLNDSECGLYYQGAVYIFQFLKSEIETGKVA